MIPDLETLFSEYAIDLDNLMRELKERKISHEGWSLSFRRLVDRYGIAAHYLGEGRQYEMKATSLAEITSVDNVSTTVNYASGYDEEWHTRAYILGFCTIKTLGEFRSRLWGAAERLFKGGSDANFIASFTRSIDQQLTEAWNLGASSVGVEPDEMSADDLQVLDAIIRNENSFVLRLAGDIDAARAEGLEPEKFTSKFGARIDLWANRYTEVVNRARVVFGAKERYKWRLGATEEHCQTCHSLNGIIAWGQEWEEAQVHPQMPPNPILECGGWRCKCVLEPTTERRTRRAFEKINNIVMQGARL